MFVCVCMSVCGISIIELFNRTTKFTQPAKHTTWHTLEVHHISSPFIIIFINFPYHVISLGSNPYIAIKNNKIYITLFSLTL